MDITAQVIFSNTGCKARKTDRSGHPDDLAKDAGTRPRPGQSTAPAGPRRISAWHAKADRHEARALQLARLIPLWPHEIENDTPEGARRIIAALESALNAERRRGKSGHWCYDVGRHMALARALKAERARAAALPGAHMHSSARE